MKRMMPRLVDAASGFLSACLLLGGGSACTMADDAAGSRGMVEELGRLSTAPRVFAPRLSLPAGYRPCTLLPPPDGTIPRAGCGTSPEEGVPSPAIIELAGRASAAVQAEIDPDAMHTAALVDLLWADRAGNPLRRSISYLEKASRLADHPAPVLADLAAVYLVRAEATQSVRDLLEALEAAERAIELEPRSEAAHFNAALALDHLGLAEQSSRAWRRYLLIDSTSEWAGEARRRVRELATAAGPPSPPTGFSAAAAAEYVSRAPQEAQILGWEQLLGDWGAAVLRGDTAQAADLLRRAFALGAALERKGGDATLADAVRAIHAHASEPAGTTRLARAHRAYAAGRAAYAALDYPAAERRFAEVVATPAGSPALRRWSAVFLGATLMYAALPDSAERLLRPLVAEVDTARHPAQAGRARWALATTLFRGGRYQEAIGRYREAARLFKRAGEREHLGAVQYLEGDVAYALGDVAQAYSSMHRAIIELRPYRGSVWLHNLLYVMARAAAADGLGRAAVRLQDEGVVVAVRTGIPTYAAEAYLARARLLAAAGPEQRAAGDVSAAREAIGRMRPDRIRDWLQSDLRMAESMVARRSDPARAAAALDSVVAFFEGLDNPLRLLPALLSRAEARFALGRIPDAEADLQRAVALLEGQSTAMSLVSLRASLLDSSRAVFDRVVMLRVAAGQPVEALAYLEQGRVSLAPAPGRPAAAAPRSPDGQVVVEYALIGDTLLAWTIAGPEVHLSRTTLDREAFTWALDRARSSLELRADASTARPALAELFDLLIRPLESRLGPPGMPVVVVADGEIAAIPFAALYDRARDRYLVEDHPLRFTSTAAAALSRPERRGRDAVVVVADPAFAPRAFPGLDRLPGAQAEADSVAAAYPVSKMLAGSAAGRAALEAVIGSGGVVHYAGHAFFDDERPDRSHLVLASPRGGSGRLAATDIERLDLGGVRLVVLSACETSRPQDRRSGGLAGLAGAFLAAGADGVVGSLWRVDDRLTLALMPELHRVYRASGDGAHALRAAQLRLLRSSDPALSSPAAWAGFRYVGA